MEKALVVEQVFRCWRGEGRCTGVSGHRACSTSSCSGVDNTPAAYNDASVATKCEAERCCPTVGGACQVDDQQRVSAANVRRQYHAFCMCKWAVLLSLCWLLASYVNEVARLAPTPSQA